MKSEDLSPEERAARQASEAQEEAAASARRWALGARLRNYFLTGIVVVGPVAITLYLVWWFISYVDQWVKPLVPKSYDPDTYLPFAVPGFGLIFSAVVLTLIGALAANLLGRTLITSGELFVERMPIVRNLYRGLKQMFESVAAAAQPQRQLVQVGLMEFPSKGIWSLVYITGPATGEIAAVAPGGDEDHIMVWMPTGFMPPTGFVCIVPRSAVIPLTMSGEDAAKLVMTAGIVNPDRLQDAATRNGALGKTLPVVTPAAGSVPAPVIRPVTGSAPPTPAAPSPSSGALSSSPAIKAG